MGFSAAEQLGDGGLVQLGADDHQLAADICAACADFPLAGNVVELQPAVCAAVHDALAAQDHAVIAGIQLGEGVLHLGLGELAGSLHAPAGEHFIGVVVVMMMTAAAMTVMVVVMLVLLVIMLVVLMLVLVLIIVMIVVVTAAAVVIMIVLVVVVVMMLVLILVVIIVIMVMMMVMRFLLELRKLDGEETMLIARHALGLSAGEIAESMNMNGSTVYKRLSRALVRAEKILKEAGFDERRMERDYADVAQLAAAKRLFDRRSTACGKRRRAENRAEQKPVA